MKSVIEIKNRVMDLFCKYGVEKVALFGSILRKDFGQVNDIDFLIKTPRSLDLFKMISLQNSLEERLGKKVDLVEYSTIKPCIRDDILSQQLVIYEK
jgi:uncharacterized protein